MNTLEQYRQELLALIPDSSVSLVVIGELDADYLSLLGREPTQLIADINEYQADGSGVQRHASVFVSIETNAIAKLLGQIGRLCQQFPDQVLIELQHDSNGKTAAQAFHLDCFAMGFRQAQQSVSDDMEYQLYEYRLKNYKQVPDWLNARFWAHPERFKVFE